MDRKLDAVSAMRIGTQDLHRSLESRPVFASLVAPSVRVEDYRIALDTLLRSYVLIEPALVAGLQTHLPEHIYRPRLPLLRRDLDSLGHPSPVPSTLLPTTTPSLAETLGALYVVEGSSLGGVFIMQHLRERLAQHCSHAMAYYSLDGALDPSHWNLTRSHIERKLADVSMLDAATASARQIFTVFLKQADRRI